MVSDICVKAPSQGKRKAPTPLHTTPCPYDDTIAALASLVHI